MKWGSSFCILARALPALSSAPRPYTGHDVSYAAVRQPLQLDLEVYDGVERRLPTFHLGTFSLARQFPKNYVLLQIALGKKQGISPDESTSETTSLTVTCPSCYTTGEVVVTTTGVTDHSSIISSIWHFIEHPSLNDVVSDLDLDIKFSLENIGGHFEFDIAFAEAGSYTVTLFKSETPVGVEINESDKVGVVIELDVIFTVQGQVDFTVGFDVSFPPGANIIIDPFTGKIVSMDVGGVKVNSIPFQFKKGSACVTAVLRLKGQIGVAVGFEGFGFDFEAGVFWDPVVYKACVQYQPSLPCEVAFTEDFYEDIGAYARAVANLDFAKLSVGPTAVSTYMTGPLPSQCFRTSALVHSTTIKKLTTSPVPQHTEIHVVHTSAPETRITTKEKMYTSTKAATTRKPTSPHTSHEPTQTTTSHHSAVTSKKIETSKHTSSSTEKKTESQASSYHKSPTETTSVVEKDHSKSHTPSVQHSHSTTSLKHTNSQYHTLSDQHSHSMIHSQYHTLSAQHSHSMNHSQSHTLSTQHSHSTTSLTHTYPQVTSQQLITSTKSTTEIYTVTKCMSHVEWCPYSLTSEIIQTRTIIEYTTICPATETGLTVPPSPIETITATGPASVPVVVITSSVEMTPIETPITSTVFVASSQPLITYTVTISGTTTYPVANKPSPSWTFTQAFIYATVTSTSSSSGGIGPVIYSVGGFPSAPPPSATAPPPLPSLPSSTSLLSAANTTIPGSTGLGTSTVIATPRPFVPGSGASNSYVPSVVVGMVATFLMSVFLMF